MRVVIAAVMAVHGFAHLVGFISAWRLASLQEIPYRTTVLAGHVNLGDAGIRVIGVFWLLTALAFWIVTAGALTNRGWWIPSAGAVAIVSLALCVLGWPDSRLGVPVNIAIIVALLASTRFG